MFPADFMDQFGPVVWERYSIPNNPPLSIPQDIDRYLLVFWATSGTASINPEPEAPIAGPGQPWLSTDKPIILTHALHGALVNKSWCISTTIGPIAVQIIIGRMPRGINGRAKSKLATNNPIRPASVRRRGSNGNRA